VSPDPNPFLLKFFTDQGPWICPTGKSGFPIGPTGRTDHPDTGTATDGVSCCPLKRTQGSGKREVGPEYERKKCPAVKGRSRIPKEVGD